MRQVSGEIIIRNDNMHADAPPMNCTVLAFNFRYIRNGSRDLRGRRAEVLAVVRLDVDNVALHGTGMASDRSRCSHHNALG